MLTEKLLNHNKKPRGLRVTLSRSDLTSLTIINDRPALLVSDPGDSVEHRFMLDTGRIEIWSNERQIPVRILCDIVNDMRTASRKQQQVEL